MDWTKQDKELLLRIIEFNLYCAKSQIEICQKTLDRLKEKA